MRSMAFGSVLSELTWSASDLFSFVDLADLLADLFDFFLRAPHGDEPVRAEDVVHQQSKQREAQNLPRVLPQVRASLARGNFQNLSYVHHAFASCAVSMTQACVSLASFEDSSSVAASV